MDIQRKRMLWRIPLLAAIVFAMFWGIWYLVAGEVPTVNQIKWDGDTIIKLPFTISRLWDIVFAPIWAFIFLVLIFSSKKVREDENLGIGLGFVLGAGLGVGLGFGLVLGLGVGLGAGLGAGLVLGLGLGLGAGLGVGLGFGLGAGLGVGLGFGLVLGLGVGLGAGLGFGLNLLSRKIRIDFYNWLAGKK